MKKFNLVLLVLISSAFGSHPLYAGGGSPAAPAGQPVVVYQPVQAIRIERSMYDGTHATISGTVDTPNSPLSSVTVNGLSIPIYKNSFSGVVPQGSNNAKIRARNSAGGMQEVDLTLGSPIAVHIGRAVKDGTTLKLSGYVASPGSAVTSLSIQGTTVTLGADNYFKSEIPVAAELSSAKIIALNANGAKDTLSVDFSEQAPVHGLTLKLRESGLQQVGDILKPVIDQLVPSLSGTLQAALNNLGGNAGDAFANGSYDIHSTSIAITSNSTIKLSPAAHAEKAGIKTAVGLEKIALRTTVFAKGCVFWVVCPSISVPVVADLNQLGLNGNIYLGKGIAEPADNATFADVDAQLGLSLDNIGLPEVTPVLRPLVEWAVNLIAKPILQKEVGGLLGGLVKTEVNKLINSKVPTKIPALLVDNDNGVSKTLENLGILPLFKILVRGIGATIGVSDTFSTAQESTLAIDANFITNSVDRLIKFGYVKRDLPSSQDFLKSIQPTTSSPFDAVLIVDADMLNKTTSVLNQASLMDFTIPSIDIDKLAPNAADIIKSSNIQMRVYSNNGSPYFGVPKSDGDLLALDLTDYMLELRVDEKVLLEVNLDVHANASMSIKDNRFSIPLLAVSTKVRSAKLAGQTIDVADAGLQSLIDSMGKLASAKMLQVIEVLPLPTIPGNKIISLDTWRVGRSSADIALAIRLQDTPVVATSGSSSTATASSSTTSSTTSSAATTGAGAVAGVNIPTGLSSVLNGIGSIFTVIGGQPLDQLPDQVYDVVDPNANKPHVPAINRQPIGVKDNKFTRSHMPDTRPSQDGRLGVGAFAGKLTLLKPEKLSSAFIPSKQPLMVSDQSFDIGSIISSSPLTVGTPVQNGFSNNAICDPDVKYLPAGAKQNPYACGVGGQDDCYDIHIISTTVMSKDKTFSQLVPALTQVQIQVEEERLTSVPLTVRVEKPKTPEAKIVEAKVTGVPSVSKPYSGMLFEMNSILDGRFLLTRASGRALTWFNAPKDKYVTGTYDNVYTVFPDTVAPCDVSAFNDWKPISHAPYDPRVKDKYKFAAYPFRDPTGEYIPDGAEIKGTYPWISRDGSMIGFSAIGISRLFPNHHINPNDTKQRYPSRCLPDEPTCSVATRADVQFRSLDTGIAFAGLWTQGKVVLADGLINEIDFKLGNAQGDKEHSLVALYEPNTGKLGNESGEIEVGETRQTSVPGGDGTKLGNGTIFDSTTNLLNANKHIKPVSPRDVVWTFNSGRQSDELAFDDYLNPNGFIVSDMVGALAHKNGNSVAMTYYDGWNQAAMDFVNPVRLQNSATALPNVWKTPAFGEVHFGRLEPTATGGIRGKGLWLDGLRTYVSYKVPKQPQAASAKPWFISLAIDPRMADDNLARSLISFPDDTSITLAGLSNLQYRKAGQVVHTVSLPKPMEPKAWSHMAWQTMDGGKRISFYLNGYLLNSWSSSDALFQVKQGSIYLGGKPNSDTSVVKALRGWIDDFKMFAELTNPEVVCNHAYGTLVGLPEDYQGSLLAQSDLYPSSSHALISRIVKGYGRESHAKYACFHDNSDDYAAHLQNIPADVAEMREALIFPEGPLFHALPRPDSLNNNFCLSCHHAQGKGGLGLDALALKLGVKAKHDARRQPMQPPAIVGGNLPANWLPYSLSSATQAGASGTAVDELLMLSGLDVAPVVKGLTLVNVKTGFDIMPIEEGSSLNLSTLPAQIGLRFSANGVTRNVAYTMNGASGSLPSPFSIGGVLQSTEGERSFKPVSLAPGSYAVSATADSSAPWTVNFSAAGVAPAVVAETDNTSINADSSAESAFQTARNVFDAVVNFFSNLLTTVKEAIFGSSDASAEQVAATTALHQKIWNQSDRVTSLQSLKPAQIYFPEMNMCAVVEIGYGHSTAHNGQNIRLAACDGGANQLWHSDATGRIYSMIDQNNAAAKSHCLDGINMNSSDNVHIWGCHGGSNQQWKLNEYGKIQGIHNTSACLGANSANNNISIHTCDANGSNPYQKIEWRESQIAYYSMFESVQSGRCMGVTGDVAPGADIQQQVCDYSSDRQMWMYNGTTRKLHSKVHGAYCAAQSGSQVKLAICNDQLTQKWSIDANGRVFAASAANSLLSTGNNNASITLSTNAAGTDTQWSIQSSDVIQILNNNNNRCLEIAGAPAAGVGVRQAGSCDAKRWEQHWNYDRFTGEIRSALSPHICMTVNGAVAENTSVNMQSCAGTDKQRFDYHDGHIMLRSNPQYDLAIHGVNANDTVKIVKRTNRSYQSWYTRQVMKAGKPLVAPTAPAQRIKTSNGRCIDFGGNVPFNNNDATVWDCVGGNWQQWHFEQGQLKSAANTAFCLGFYGRDLREGTRLMTYECNDHTAMQWTQDDKGRFRSQFNNQYCIDTAGANPQNGAALVMQRCGDFKELNVLGKCIDVAPSNFKNGGNAYLWDCHGGDWQKWEHEQSTGLIRSKHNPQFCLDSTNGNGNGTNVQVYSCVDHINLKWDVVGESIRPRKNHNLALDISGGTANNGQNLHLWTVHGGSNQKFSWLGDSQSQSWTME